MADAINRTTLEIVSGDTSHLDPADWLLHRFDQPRPAIRALIDIPQHHRKVVGDVASEMNAAEKTVADAELAAEQAAATVIQNKAGAKMILDDADSVGRLFSAYHVLKRTHPTLADGELITEMKRII